MLTDAQKTACMGFYPFEGDDGDYRILEDKVVVGRKDHPCGCGEVARAGDHHRVIKGLFDGDFVTLRWCEGCCVAMTTYYEELVAGEVTKLDARWDKRNPS